MFEMYVQDSNDGNWLEWMSALVSQCGQIINLSSYLKCKSLMIGKTSSEHAICCPSILLHRSHVDSLAQFHGLIVHPIVLESALIQRAVWLQESQAKEVGFCRKH